MDHQDNPYRGKIVEFHILQSFPSTCLNRDDNNSPKTATVGGVTRARVSSQCWKRHVREAFHDLGVKTGKRTKQLEQLLQPHLIEAGADQETAESMAKHLADLLVDDTLIFISEGELKALAELAAENGFDDGKINEKALRKFIKQRDKEGVDAVDIALFGRMVAKVNEMKVEAAAGFSHALSTHRAETEMDYFAAMDDIEDQENSGSSHIGVNEFNSATYYRYISLNLGTLYENLGGEGMAPAIDGFTKALFKAVPSARQSGFSGASGWDYARVLVRDGQRLQANFEKPVRANGEGYLAPSIVSLNDFLDTRKQQFGSMFGEIADLRWGEGESTSFDELLSDVLTHVE